MTNKKIIISSIILGVLTLAVAVPFYAQAATTTTTATGTPQTHNSGKNHKNLSAAQLAALKLKMAASQAAQTAKQQAIAQAIASNDYNAWVKAVGANNPILQKINANNFSQYVALYNLEQQVITQKKALGLDQLGHGPMAWGRTAPTTEATSTTDSN